MTNGPSPGPGDSKAPAQSPPRQHDIPGSRERTPPPNADSAVSSTGIEGLDFIMRGGLPASRPTLLRGGPGTGKTVIALSILCHGLDTGEPGVLVTFDESSQALLQHADSLGLSLSQHVEAGRARILDMRPDRSELISGEDLELTAILARIGHAIEQTGAGRLVIDAIDGMEGAFAGAEASLHGELGRVFDWIRNRGTTTVITIGERGDLSSRDRIMQTLRDRNVPAERLQLELTESTLMEEPARAEEVLDRLERTGIGIVIDDFGTGYSSLNYVASLPIHTLKIDRSFVTRMLKSPRTRSVVEATISLARSLGIRAVAEGVDSKDQAEALMAMGCTEIQGFYFSRPVEADTLRHWAEGFSLASYALHPTPG